MIFCFPSPPVPLAPEPRSPLGPCLSEDCLYFFFPIPRLGTQYTLNSHNSNQQLLRWRHWEPVGRRRQQPKVMDPPMLKTFITASNSLCLYENNNKSDGKLCFWEFNIFTLFGGHYLHNNRSINGSLMSSVLTKLSIKRQLSMEWGGLTLSPAITPYTIMSAVLQVMFLHL